MHYLIYKITNKLNGKFYIGKHKTDNVNDDYFGSGLLLGRAVEKHGKANFSKETLLECKSEEEMNQKEADIVDEEFIAREDTYNIKLGGAGGWDYVRKNGLNNTPEAKAAHKRNNKPHIGLSHFMYLMENDEKFRAEYGEKISNGRRLYLLTHDNGFTGKTHTAEAKQHISKKMKLLQSGKLNSQYGTRWITDGTNNRRLKVGELVPGGWKFGRV